MNETVTQPTRLELQIADDELYEKEQREHEICKEIAEDLSRIGEDSVSAFAIMLRIVTGRIRHVTIIDRASYKFKDCFPKNDPRSR